MSELIRAKGLTPLIHQSSALKTLKTKKRSSELGVFSYFSGYS
jgi:hypothetical protein